VFTRFGQELYIRETIAAAAIVVVHEEEGSDRPLAERIADTLPQPSPATRRRIAIKLLQRITAGAARIDSPADGNGVAPPSKRQANTAHPASECSPAPLSAEGNGRVPKRTVAFARLLSSLPDTQARRELVYYAAACADGLIGALAQDLLYPYFIEDRIPAPYGEDEFIMANAGLLLAPEPILTAGCMADYARRVWGFECERTLCLALRILRQAGVLFSSPLLGQRGRVHAYTLAPHSLSLPALLWGLYDEFGRENLAPAWDQVARARFVQRFVVPPSVVHSRLWEAERAGLVGFWSVAGTRRVALKVREPEALTRLLLTGPGSK
jgi:hypothetical protein